MFELCIEWCEVWCGIVEELFEIFDYEIGFLIGVDFVECVYDVFYFKWYMVWLVVGEVVFDFVV